jgi:hypothetical protein
MYHGFTFDVYRDLIERNIRQREGSLKIKIIWEVHTDELSRFDAAKLVAQGWRRFRHRRLLSSWRGSGGEPGCVLVTEIALSRERFNPSQILVRHAMSLPTHATLNRHLYFGNDHYICALLSARCYSPA